MARLGGDDAYLTLGWNLASRHLEPGEASVALLHHATGAGELALLLLLRRLRDGAHGFDATSAYGYGDPIAIRNVDVEVFGDALDAWARANDVVASFLRFHPTLATQ